MPAVEKGVIPPAALDASPVPVGSEGIPAVDELKGLFPSVFKHLASPEQCYNRDLEGTDPDFLQEGEIGEGEEGGGGPRPGVGEALGLS